MTVDQFSAQLDAFGEEALDLTSILNDIARDITTQMKADLRTGQYAKGNLKNSIFATASPDKFEIEMLAYGIPQNYGVVGTANNYGAKPIQDGLQGAGKVMTFGTFKTIGGDLPFGIRKYIAEKGIKPKNFFNMDDITEEVNDRILEALTNNFN
tara:strand:+ start:42 stop:503 length:462 start_codon:yes stop_codon:yes gene_type:complete